MKLLLWSILFITWPWKLLLWQQPLLTLDQFMSSIGRYVDDFIGFVDSRHEVKILHFVTRNYKVVEATTMRWCSHMALWRPFYNQKCLQLACSYIGAMRSESWKVIWAYVSNECVPWCAHTLIFTMICGLLMLSEWQRVSLTPLNLSPGSPWWHQETYQKAQARVQDCKTAILQC